MVHTSTIWKSQWNFDIIFTHFPLGSQLNTPQNQSNAPNIYVGNVKNQAFRAENGQQTLQKSDGSLHINETE